MLSPERSIEIQCLLGSDIQMQFDECIELPAERSEVERAMELSLRWAERSKRAFDETCGARARRCSPSCRAASMRSCAALGGSARRYGLSRLRRRRACGRRRARSDAANARRRRCRSCLSDKPRYLMGVGTPLDLIESVARGVDMFDCVMPTRNGRHGYAFTWGGRINMQERQARRRYVAARRLEAVPGGARLFAAPMCIT